VRNLREISVVWFFFDVLFVLSDVSLIAVLSGSFQYGILCDIEITIGLHFQSNCLKFSPARIQIRDPRQKFRIFADPDDFVKSVRKHSPPPRPPGSIPNNIKEERRKEDGP
jgi:hypothetical protein